MAKKQKAEEAKPGAPAWMVTFSDMTTLLLTFFIMLLSFATFDPTKTEKVILSLRGALGASPRTGGIIMPMQNVPPVLMTTNNIRTEREKIRQRIHERGLSGRLRVAKTEEGITITMLEPITFDPGEAILKPEVYNDLDAVAEILQDYQNKVRIEGYCAPVPLPQHSPFADKWELSGARARVVLEYLITRHPIDERRLNFAGYGDNHPIVDVSHAEHERFNNRVEVKLVAEDMPQRWFQLWRDPKTPDDQTEIR